MKDVIDFAYRHGVPSAEQAGNNLPGRAELFLKLQARDLKPGVSLHAEEAFTEHGIEMYGLVEGVTQPKALGHIALQRVGVIINRLDGSIKKDRLPDPEALPPMINENATRSLAFRKIRTHQEVLEPLGLSIPTRLVSSGEDIDAFLAKQNAAHMIIKPDNGSNSARVVRVERDVLKHSFEHGDRTYGLDIVQPAFDFTVPFPANTRAYDNESREAFEGWSRSNTRKELRVYGFHSPAGTAVFPVARAFEDGDQWFFLDPESMPDRVIEGTKQAISRAASVSGAFALYGTVDYGYGTDGTRPTDWYAVELNARMPYLIGYKKHSGVADALHEHFADQIQATALAA